MSDIIRLLSDSVANQIAAGEVVQRPASVVKELLENSIDAGATQIKLYIKEAGRSLVQVIDNGKGMSITDARMAFERHATSKISQAEDLFSIRTKGFRGEALASIAAVAQVELKTKRKDDSLGTVIEIEGSEIKLHEPVATNDGTIFSVKNLFFNVPARRNFLKSNPVELKHIIDEFQRIALAHPEIDFQLTNGTDNIYNLPKGNLRQRIVSIFGKAYDKKLAPLEEKTDYVKIYGFIGKPEHSRKTRGEQFFFVNNRFIKSHFLNHAVQSCYQGLIPKDHFASYFLFIEVDPKTIDVNIHPTKTEIKFEDEREIYAILNSATRRAIGMFNLSPSLDFETEASLEITNPPKDKILTPPIIKVNPNYNPFHEEAKNTEKLYPKESSGYSKSATYNSSSKNTGGDDWKKLFENQPAVQTSAIEKEITTNWGDDEAVEKKMLLIKNRYIVSPVHSGIWIIDRVRATERILFEKFMMQLKKNEGNSQQLLFPHHLQMNASDYSLIMEMRHELLAMGFDFDDLGNGSISINGMPVEAVEVNPEAMVDQILEDFKNNSGVKSSNNYERLALSLAQTISKKEQHILNNKEMNLLVNNLFQCEVPNFTLGGKPIVITFSLEEIEKKFN